MVAIDISGETWHVFKVISDGDCTAQSISDRLCKPLALVISGIEFLQSKNLVTVVGVHLNGNRKERVFGLVNRSNSISSNVAFDDLTDDMREGFVLATNLGAKAICKITSVTITQENYKKFIQEIEKLHKALESQSQTGEVPIRIMTIAFREVR